MEQLLAHLVGDFWMQTDWMALKKKNPGWEGLLACLLHCVLYGLPFLLLTRSWKAMLVIVATHAVIDRSHIVPWLIWVHNLVTPPPVGTKHLPYRECLTNGGYHPSRPAWIAIWLSIITDNSLHLLINYAALRWL